MPSGDISATPRVPRPSRRRFLASLGVTASVATAGCSGAFGGSDTPNTDGAAEVIIENRTTSRVEIAVRVLDGEDGTLFSRVFALDPETITSRHAIETTPSRIQAFTPEDVSRTWQYDPDLSPEFDCEPKDIGLTLHADDTIEPWYDC